MGGSAAAIALYNTLLTFTPDGELGNHHRKLVPTYSERMVWGSGDAAGLKSVEVGGLRVGGLICWEHWMPLARMAMHNAGERRRPSLLRHSLQQSTSRFGHRFCAHPVRGQMCLPVNRQPRLRDNQGLWHETLRCPGH